MGNNLPAVTNNNNSDSGSNAELDEAFSRLQMYLYASENHIVKTLLYKNIEELTKIIAKRDASMSFRLHQHLLSLKQWIRKTKNG